MQVGRRYSLFQTLNWGRKYILWFLLFDSIVISLYYFTQWSWMAIPWQPISLIGIAVAFYLGFKNNSSYERLWEARKIWGGIVNDSRSFTVYTRDFINNDDAQTPQSEKQLQHLRKQVVQRHIAWLYALTYQLRVVKDWEHKSDFEQELRTYLGTQTSPDSYKKLANYLSQQEYDYIMSKDNKASHLLSLQSKALMNLRKEGIIEHFRHLEIQNHIRSFYELQGKIRAYKEFSLSATVCYCKLLFCIVVHYTIAFWNVRCI
ncbi:MAG: bestrophin family ion channel [Chitinophagales bacterium]